MSPLSSDWNTSEKYEAALPDPPAGINPAARPGPRPPLRIVAQPRLAL